MSYHSDLDIILIYEGPARPAWDRDGSGQADSHQHFTELAQSMIRRANPPANFGRLYQVDMRLRPDGRSGALVASLPEFLRHHASNTIDRLWEKLALVRARPIAGDMAFGMEVMAALDAQRKSQPWLEEGTQEVLAMRLRLEASRPHGDLKRGPGGLTDIEFLSQALQLKHANRLNGSIEPGTRKALGLLAASGLLPRAVTDELGQAHEFLSRCLARLRLAHNRSIDELPLSDPESISLADEIRKRVRQLFTAWIDA
jgi:glutamate-ammonia-ligase adenylyltransferase